MCLPSPTMMKCPSAREGGVGVCWVFFGSWFQIVSHLHPPTQLRISNCFEIAAPANHLITLALKPLELGWTQQ